MPWKNQSGGGGGPWGGDGGGPWGGGGSGDNGGSGGGGGGPWGSGGGRGPNQPGFDDLIRQSQDRMKRLLPGGFLGGRGIALIVIAVVVIWLATGFYRVQPGEQGVVLRFGEFAGITDPGLNYRLPSPIEDHEIVNVNLERLTTIGVRGGTDSNRENAPIYNLQESRILTGDENLVDLGFAIVWNVIDAPAFIFNMRDPETTVRFIGESVMREIIGQRQITELIVSTGAATEADAEAANARREIEVGVATLLQERLNFYETGISVVNVQLQGLDPPTEVIDAFRDVQNAESEAEAMINEARAYANQVVPRARAEAYSVTQQAHAYSERVRAQADGDAARFLQVLQAYTQAKDIVAERLYIETVSTVFSNLPKVIIDLGAATQGVLPYLPLDAMQTNVPRPADANAGGN